MPSKKRPQSLWKNRIVDYGEVSPADLHPSPMNWRTHPQFQREALLGILREVGLVQDVLVSKRSGHIVDGHLRVALALQESQPTIPVKYVDLSEHEEQLILTTLDPITGLAQADEARLRELLDSTHAQDVALQDFLRGLVTEYGVQPEPQDLPPGEEVEPHLDRAEELRQQYGVEPGQIWQCGRHRVMCGDALDETVLQHLVSGGAPRMIFADPPYGISIAATNESVGGGEAYDIPFGGVKNRRPHNPAVGGGQRYKDKTGHYPIERRRGSDGAAAPFGSTKMRGTIGAPHVVPVGKYFPIEGDDTTRTAIQAATTLLGLYPQAIHIWWGGNYYADHLPPSACWLVWDKETTGHFADCELAWTNQAKAAKLFRHRWNGMLRDSEREKRWHPTQKPAALAAWAYQILGTAQDTILDPFLGAGPSLLAAEQTGRTLSGIEIIPEYVAVSLDRWARLTGQTPTLLSTARQAAARPKRARKAAEPMPLNTSPETDHA